MSDTAAAEVADLEDGADEAPKKKGKMGLILALVALLLCGGGGFFATYSGMVALPLGGDKANSKDGAKAKAEPDLPPVAFLPTGEMIISLGPNARAQHLLIEAELEVAPEYLAEMELLRPRVLDVFNTFLRAVEERDLEDPGAMPRLRAQLLRRVQIVTGPDRIRDLLITRFILR
ncbi:MAG: flagellar basal body-associated FliL family protein [Pseudomonadota bacterium]